MFKYITFSLILIALLAANIYYWHEPFLGIILTLIYLLYFGQRLGSLALPAFNHFWQRLFGPLILLAGLSVVGTIIYHLYALHDGIIIVLLAIFPAGLIPYCHLFKKKIDEWPSGHLEAVPLIEPNTRPANRWAWLVLLGDGYLFYYLFTQATTAAVNSPWNLVSYKFFLIFFLLTFCLILFINRTESSLLSFFTIFIHSFLLLSVALIIYKLGYGFDPFIHRLAETYIAKFGQILPKTPYYIGQYVLVVMLSKMTALSLAWLDKILLPVLEALILPPLIFLTLRHGLGLARKEARLGSILFFLIPFGALIATTPQDLANFFALTLILFGALFLTTQLIPWWVPLLLTLTTLVIHPLIGLPMLIFYLFLTVLSFPVGRAIAKKTLRTWGLVVVSALAICVLPAVLIIFLGADFHFPTLKQLVNLLTPPALPQTRPDHPFSFLFFLVYHYQYLLSLLILIVSALGGYQLFKPRRDFGAKKPLIYLSLISFVILILNVVILKLFLLLPNIINYEQPQYANRLYNFSFYLLLPLFLFGLIYLIKRVTEVARPVPSFISLSLYLLMALLLTASFYLSYPRMDNYAFSRSFNVSQADLEGVHQIEKKAAGEDYLVLSHQIFSAAALQEFGFKKYYHTPRGEIFYYSLPTSGPLYNYFQKMVYQGASRETMSQAMDLVGTNQAYLVIHDYWNSFKTAAPQAKQTADEWWEVEGGGVLVFRYKK